MEWETSKTGTWRSRNDSGRQAYQGEGNGFQSVQNGQVQSDKVQNGGKNGPNEENDQADPGPWPKGFSCLCRDRPSGLIRG